VQVSPTGLECAGGGFHVDPWSAVDRAIITHAHSDHARPGSRHYLCSTDGAGLLRLRLGPDAHIETLPYGERQRIGDVVVSLHPAGHVLGSVQVRIENDLGRVAVVGGDHKIDQHDPTCRPFEPVECHHFISESTFGLPVYRWSPAEAVHAEIADWWREARKAGRTAVIFAYALGKAQRVLAGLDDADGPILLHGAVARTVPIYQAEGVRFPRHAPATPDACRAERGRAIVIAPPSAARSPWMRRFGDSTTGFASGWMRVRGARRRRSMDRGFVLSDHADWPGLHRTIELSRAEHVGLTHGFTGVMARVLRDAGHRTSVLPTRFEGEEGSEATIEGSLDDSGADAEALPTSASPDEESDRRFA